MSMSPLKDAIISQPVPSTVLLCRRGQETVQEIVAKTSDIFQYLRTVQLPNGAVETVQKFQERKNKLDEQIRQLEILFRKLRNIYDRVNDATANLDAVPVEDLLPYEDDDANQEDKPAELKSSSDEERELIEVKFIIFDQVSYKETIQIQLKSRQLKEIIDLLRTVIWEINTMMVMRRTGSQ